MLLPAFPIPSLPGLVAESPGSPRGACRASCPFCCHTGLSDQLLDAMGPVHPLCLTAVYRSALCAGLHVGKLEQQ